MPRDNLLLTARPEDWRRPSVIALLLANALPVLGVLMFKWDVFPLILLFWLENLVVGGFNVLKLVIAGAAVPKHWTGKLFLVPFFCVHYGIFCFVHGMFVFTLFGREHLNSVHGLSFARVADVVSQSHLGWALAALVVSHGISFGSNFLGRGEYRRTDLGTLMMQPYARVVVLHVTLLASGFILLTLRSPVIGLMILVGLKTVLDLRAHLRERHRFDEVPPQ